MTVRVGGMRALNASVGNFRHGAFTMPSRTLTDDRG
jgi:catalase (peroxidase I)